MNVPWVHQRSTLQNAHRTQSNGLLGARSTEGELWGGTQLSRKKKSITREELHLVSTHRTLHPGDSTSQAALAAVSTGHKTGAVRLLQSLQGGSQHRPQRSKTNTQEKHPYSSGKPAVQRPKGWT